MAAPMHRDTARQKVVNTMRQFYDRLHKARPRWILQRETGFLSPTGLLAMQAIFSQVFRRDSMTALPTLAEIILPFPRFHASRAS